MTTLETPQDLEAKKRIINVPPNTMGFIFSYVFFKYLINLVSLGGKFPNIILNFEEDRVWWENKSEGFFVYNYGFFSHRFVKHLWGTGTACLNTKYLLDGLKATMKGYPEFIFWVHNETRNVGMYAGNIDKTKLLMIPTDNIRTAESIKLKIRLDKDFIPNIPLVKEEEQFRYGGELEASLLKEIAKRAKAFHTFVQFKLGPKPEIIVKYDIIKYSSKNKLTLSEANNNMSNLKVPPITIEYLVPLEEFQKVVKNYKEDDKVSLLFSGNNKRPIFLLKREDINLGTFVSGVLIGTMEMPPKPQKRQK